MTYQIVIPAGNRLCACGCGELINELDKQGRQHRFKFGHMNKGQNHPFYGKHHTEGTRKKMSQSHKGYVPWNKSGKNPKVSGKNHHSWKGDNVGYRALHEWVKYGINFATQERRNKNYKDMHGTARVERMTILLDPCNHFRIK
jgi:hypothetical protein